MGTSWFELFSLQIKSLQNSVEEMNKALGNVEYIRLLIATIGIGIAFFFQRVLSRLDRIINILENAQNETPPSKSSQEEAKTKYVID